jgi:2-haloacid dehalogenase
MKISSIIFDLGNVLIYWDPKNLFDEDYFDSLEKRDYFLQNICTDAWNEEQDAGRSISEATSELISRYPDWEKPIRDYYGRWTEMLDGPIHGSVELFRKLKDSGKYKLFALTNWNACLFEIALVRYDFLQWFDGRVVSGEEKMRKPDPEFYKILETRYGMKPEEALFIDDNLRNIKAAKELGMHVVQFKNPEQLQNELGGFGIGTRNSSSGQ